MNAQSFLNSFGYIANAPDGVKRLREMVLHYAVSGSLVAQIDSEGSAEKDLERAGARREEFQKQYKIRKRKATGLLKKDDIFFSIPANWKWARLENLACYIQRGKGPKYAQSGRALVVSQKCIQWSGFDLAPARRSTDDSLEKYGDERFLVENDILWNSTGTGTAGRVALFSGASELVVADSHITVIRLANFIPQYVWCYLASPTIQGRMVPNQEGSMVSGTTNQVELSTSKVSELAVPCPPIAEQNRIVAKVDELMALCDKLEAQQQERKRRFPVLSRACHVRFVESPNPDNLKVIFNSVGTVSPDDLRSTILSLAVQGKLVRQRADEVVDEELSSRRKCPKNPLKTSERLFSLPENWTWARLGDIYKSSLYGPRFGKNEYVTRGGIPTVRTTDMTMKGEIILRNPPHVEIKDEKKLTSYALKANDLLVTRSGTIGMMAVFKESYTAIPSAYLIRFRFPESVLADFYYIYLSSPYGLDLLGLSLRSIGVPNVNATSISRFPAPLPPLPEQQRIVAKVDQLMTFVDKLEEQQRKKAKVAEAFAQASVSAITGTDIKEPEKMKAPKTELVSRLRTKSKPKATDQAPLSNLLTKHKGELTAKTLWQQSGLEIDAFYQQLKTEMANGWIVEPEKAVMQEVEAN